MADWWYSLGSARRGWFLLSGFVTLFVLGLAVGIVVLNVAPVLLEPLVHLGFGTACFGLLGTLVTAMVRM